jgi:uncharacterized DUF497 family protein
VNFIYDPKKAASNLRKHTVPFEEAVTIFGDVLSSTVPDPGHSEAESRFVTLGLSSHGRLLVVSHAEIGEDIRIISARRATSREKKQYEEGR